MQQNYGNAGMRLLPPPFRGRAGVGVISLSGAGGNPLLISPPKRGRKCLKCLPSFCWAVLWVMLAFLPLSAHAVTVKEIQTPAGVTAWLVEDHSQPIIAARVLFADAGTAAGSPEKSGAALVTADMLMEGAGERDALAFAKAAENAAVQLSTGAEEDALSVSLKTLRGERAVAFSLLADLLQRPRFDAAALARVSAQHVSALKQAAEDPGYLAESAWRAAAFPGHPYGAPPLGRAEDITRLTPQDLRDFTAQHLTRANARVAMVGDVTEKEAATLIDQAMGALPAGKTASALPDVAVAATKAPQMITHDIPQTVVVFGWQGVKRSDADYLAAYVLNEILGGGGLTSRLSKSIREEAGLAYYAQSDLDPMLHGATLHGVFATRNDQVARAVEIFKKTIADTRDKGVTAQELQAAKDYITGSFAVHMDGTEKLAAYLANLQLHGLPVTYIAERNALINAVTLADVNRMAAKLLSPAPVLVQVGGK